MKKIVKQKPQDEQVLDVLKKLTKRIEEATVDIHSIKFDVKATKLDVGFMQSDFAIMKVDVEKIKEQIEQAKEGLEKRITHVADLITISLGNKLQKVKKRVHKLERVQQTA